MDKISIFGSVINITYVTLFLALSTWILSKQYFNPPNKGYNCLVGTLTGTERGSGMGNIIFEFISFVAIARDHDRIPVLRNTYTKQRLLELQSFFPNLREIMPSDDDINCGREKRIILKDSKCCVYEPGLVMENDLTKNSSLSVIFYYLQSYKYFSNDTSLNVRRLLQGSPYVSDQAKTKLIRPRLLKSSKFNICIHVRRGDFLRSWRHEPSRSDFTVAVHDYLNHKYANYSPTTFVFGNDPTWSEDLFKKNPNVEVASFHSLNPPNIDWEFSRLYCDVVALTASASTYGWWMAYMSRGGIVYYNSKFSQPFGVELELSTEDFFPPDWTSLSLKNGQIIEG